MQFENVLEYATKVFQILNMNPNVANVMLYINKKYRSLENIRNGLLRKNIANVTLYTLLYSLYNKTCAPQKQYLLCSLKMKHMLWPTRELFKWEVGWAKKWDGKVFVPLFRVNFFKPRPDNKTGWTGFCPAFCDWNCISDFMFPFRWILLINYCSRFNI